MAYFIFSEELMKTCKDLVEKTTENNDLREKIMSIASCCTGELTIDNKSFLTGVKQISQIKSLPDETPLLQFLVTLYLSIGNKNPAKKVLSSHFQGLPSSQRDFVLELLCQRVKKCCEVTTGNDSSRQGDVRHIVNLLAALMDNFALAMVFLARAQEFFFRQFRQGGQSAVQANAVMHDCHVTMQALNRLTQRHLPRGADLTPPLSQSTLVQVMQMDIDIMLEDQMMVDCRCCCSINLILLLHMFASDCVPQFLKSSLALEPEGLHPPSWLAEVQLSQLTLPSLPPMASLALLWGQLSMLDLPTLSLATPVTRNVSVDDVGTRIKKSMPSVITDPADVSKVSKAVNVELCPKDSSITDSAVTVSSGVESEEVVTMETRVAEEGQEKGAEGGGEACLVLEVLMERLLCLDEKCQSTGSRVQCIKTVTLWTTRMVSCLREATVSPVVRCRLRGDSPAVQQLLGYVWTHWDDQLDVIRQNSRINFDSCLKLHIMASQCKDAASDPFLLSLLERVLQMDWGTPWKFPALSALVGVVGASPILHRHPLFPSTLLAQMADQAVACHASELYEVLIGGSKKGGGARGQSDRDREDNWLAVWIDPVITLLCSSHKKLRQHIIEYILPKVMKNEKTVLEYMLSKLSSASETGVETQGALIVCLRRARAWGLATEVLNVQDGAAPVWTRVFSALSSAQEQVRLDAFALLCENKRTAETVGRVEFDYVRHFIASNLNNQTPAFRQTMLAFSKKFFFRVNESQQAMFRQRKKKQKVVETSGALQNYASFLSWLEEFLFSQLYPSSAFARRTMSLAILSFLTEEVHGDPEPNGYRPLRGITVNQVHTLLECLTDTFEENKEAAHKLLLACTSQHPGLLTEEMCQELYSAAMQLAVSTRPQDCGTAAYLCTLLLHQPHVCSITQPWGQLPQTPACFQQETSSVQGTGNLVAGEESAAAGSKEAPKPMDTELTKLMAEMTVNYIDSNTSATLRLLQSLLTLVGDQVTVAQTSLILAAAHRPMYPTLHCIRYVLHSVSYKSLKEKERAQWTTFVNCLLHVCLKVAEVVSPVVQNSSPEGNIPDEAILGPGLKFDLGLMAEVEESRQTVALMPEYLIVCCWRSIKEVSLLLGQLCLNVPVMQPGVCEGLLSFQQMEKIGAYFKQQLMESLHRGAFELAYAGFIMMCQRLWKSPWNKLQTLPRRWLEEVMSAIMSSEESSALCATRRSAGVPFFIQAIVATEAPSSGRPSFHQAMGQLLTIALSSAAASPSTITDAQVHALNVLRALFKDTRLGEDVAVYVSDGLKASILGFKSQYWEVRNSATLLLSALMTRIFGVKRSKDESVLSKRNSQTGRSFFHKYPALYPFLLAELEMATQNLGSSGQFHLHPSLYPVLMVLGRLFPSTMEGTSTRLNLAAFLPHVIRCSSSPVYKTRMMAARALQPLVGKEQLTSVLTLLLNSLPTGAPTSDGAPLIHSHVHGLLLQVYHLVLLSEDMTGSTLQTLMSVCLAGWGPLTWLITRQNPCLCTRKVALDITDLILSYASPLTTSLPASDKRCLDAITQDLLLVLTAEVWSPPSPPYSPHTPFLSEMLSSVARLAMRYLCGGGEAEEGEGVVLRLLDFATYEVHLTVVDWFLDGWVTRKTCGVEEAKESDPHPDLSSSGNTQMATVQTRNDTAAARYDYSGVAMTTPVVDRLLDMGLEEGAHPETVVKIFQLLSLPAVQSCFGDKLKPSSVFEKLLLKLQKEKRADVKASLIQFTGSLLPYVYCNFSGDGSSPADIKTRQLLRDWSQVVSSSCHAEQPDDLQLSCARVLRDSWEYLLVDKEGRLGLVVLEFWSSLVTLLQADDLEVKDVVASVTSKLGPRDTGDTHPEVALGQLISTMLHLHADSKLQECVGCVLSWVKPQVSPLDEATERLFDKGELNTFQDSVCLARVVSHCLQQFFSNNTQHHEQQDAQNPSPCCQSQRPPSESFSSLWTSTGDCTLMQMLQDSMDVMRRDFGLSEAERDSMQSVFLRGSVYCERVVFFIQLVLLVGNLQNLPEFWTGAGAEDVRQLCRQVTECVKSELARPASCNFLLGRVVEKL